MPVGLFGAMFLLFLVLKLTGVIDWSWWFVTMPLWIGAVLFTISMAALTLLDAPKKRK